MKKPLHLAFIISTCWLTASAQNGYTPAVSTLTFSGTVHQSAMLVDHAGHHWIGIKPTGSGTDGGLVYFDGINWNLYNTSTTPALPSLVIQALANDNSGNVWIGTPAGLVKWSNGNFTTYTTANGLPSNDIKSIAASGSMVYIGTYQGLSRYDGSTFTNYNIGNGGLATDTVNAIDVENSGTIWLGSYNRLIKFSINASYSSFSSQTYFISGTAGLVNAIYHDAQNTKWVGMTALGQLPNSYSNGLLIFNGSSFASADSVYTMFGTSIPSKVIDLCEGPRGGVAFRGINNLSTPYPSASTCILELMPGGKVYQYFQNLPHIPLWGIGDFVEKDGSSLMISHDGLLTAYDNAARVMYQEFDPSNYSPFNLSVVNNDNFKTLDINQVYAGIANEGDMHWDIGGAGKAMYQVPKTNNHRTAASTDFTSAMWITGYDGGGLLHNSAQTYRQSGTDFWPGPLDTTYAATNNTIAAAYDKIWKVSYTDINDFVTNFNSGNVQNHSYLPTDDILTWPARGTGNVSRNLAPFVDLNHNGIYDPLTGGDYPQIKGDQALYFIFNDKGPHTATGCNHFGFEIQGMAYAYGCPNVVQGRPELQYTTFYDYKITNRSFSTYHDVNIALFSDADLGYYLDDYVGCNVQENYGYLYNGDNFDESVSGTPGYGNYPPAQGYAYMQGPLADTGDGLDNDNDGTIDEAGEQCLMNQFTYFNNNFPGTPQQTQDPSTCGQYNCYLNAKWRDCSPFTCGGNGYGGTVPTSFAFPDNTYPGGPCGNGWTETSAGNQPNDRRIIMRAGPFKINSFETKELEYAFVTSFDSTVANSPMNSVAKLQTDIQKVRNFYAMANKPNCLVTAVTGIEEAGNAPGFSVYPNPANNILNVKLADGQDVKIRYELTDMLGKTMLKGSSQNAQQFSISVADLSSGVYFLKITGRGPSVKKIIKD